MQQAAWDALQLTRWLSEATYATEARYLRSIRTSIPIYKTSYVFCSRCYGVLNFITPVGKGADNTYSAFPSFSRDGAGPHPLPWKQSPSRMGASPIPTEELRADENMGQMTHATESDAVYA